MRSQLILLIILTVLLSGECFSRNYDTSLVNTNLPHQQYHCKNNYTRIYGPSPISVIIEISQMDVIAVVKKYRPDTVWAEYEQQARDYVQDVYDGTPAEYTYTYLFWQYIFASYRLTSRYPTKDYKMYFDCAAVGGDGNAGKYGTLILPLNPEVSNCAQEN